MPQNLKWRWHELISREEQKEKGNQEESFLQRNMQFNDTHWWIEVSEMCLSEINEATERVWELSSLSYSHEILTDKIKAKLWIFCFILGIEFFLYPKL